MPNRDDLPEELRAITRHNALELSDQRWRLDVGRLISTLDELVGETPAGQTAPPAVAASPPSRAKRARRPSLGARGRWGLLGVLTVAAIAVAVVVASDGGGDYQALLKLIPADIRRSCQKDSSAEWMLDGGEASAQTLCGDTSKYYLTYGLWPSPREAQDWVLHGARDPNTDRCEASTDKGMQLILPPGATPGCEDKPNGHKDGRGIAMWWSEDDSRVAAWYARPDHNEQADLRQLKRLVTTT
jgi:hypothetical protein